MNCIVIDDSANALELMKIHVAKVPFLNLAGAYQSALEALDILNSTKIDLIFTDINMPEISGMEFVKSIKQDSLIIFTTAYSEFALEGYEVNAIDYLLKPISFEKFLKVANKAYEYHKQRQGDEKTTEPVPQDRHVILKSATDFHRLHQDNIVFLESQGNYMKIQLEDGTHIMSLLTMKEALEKLSDGRFFRCHRGFIISLEHISKISVSEVTLTGIKIPIGKSYRLELQKRLGLKS